MTPSWYLFVRCVCEYIRKEEERERRRRENLQKYIFLITVTEVNAAYLGVPTAAGGGGVGGLFDRRGRQTAHREAFKTEFTYRGVRPRCLIAICCTEEGKKSSRGEEAEAER